MSLDIEHTIHPFLTHDGIVVEEVALALTVGLAVLHLARVEAERQLHPVVLHHLAEKNDKV
jgi:hypothetical protein